MKFNFIKRLFNKSINENTIKVKTLKYQIYNNGPVKVRSHHYKKGFWVINEKYDEHDNISKGKHIINNPIMFRSEKSKLMKNRISEQIC